MVEWPLPPEVVFWVAQLATPLHARHAGRLLPLLRGLLFAQGRRTVASWLRAAGLGPDFRRYYYFLGSLGHRVEFISSLLVRRAVSVVAPGDRLLFGLDDTPTKRYGRHVEGAGIHHNPTPGPADQKFLYGHLWVTLAWVVRHPLWGAIGLPLRALLYVRRQDVTRLPRWYRVAFRTKLEMAGTLVAWVADWLRFLGKTLWVVADGAYAKRPFLKAARAAGVVVVSRLRKDAALWSVPVPPRPGIPKKRGPRPTYGKEAISLAKRAGHRRGWQTEDFCLYGKKVAKTFKTFLATYKPAGGLIRVVLVREDDGWVAFFCTDAQATVGQVLEAIADRAAIEQDFHDLKEVHGVGQQQVRHYWANVAVYHLNLWLHTLIELWAREKSPSQLCDRSDSPWDDPARRPSHADRRNALRRQCLRTEIQAVGRRRPLSRRLGLLLRGLLKLAA
ncbi:MAG: transposase [Halobacteriales archaeon]|nr:transposase [Halobacteriales archaeon]